ncbi:MAG: F0F1 ATP synthase subunit A [Bacteroidia bacterium]
MASKYSIVRSFKPIYFLLFSLFLSVSVFAFEPTELEKHEEKASHDSTSAHLGAHADEKKPVDISKVAFEHILDSHSWHLFGEGHDAVSIPLPVILKTNNGLSIFSSGEFHHDVHGMHVVEKNGERFVNFEEKIYYASETANEHGQYLDIEHEGSEVIVKNDSPLDFSLTKNATQLVISALVLILIFTSIAKAYKSTGVTTAPKGKQSFFEPLIVFVRDDLAKSNISHNHEKFVPFLLTVFFLILLNNVFGLIPIGANLTGNIAFTLVLSVITLIVTNVNANGAYWHHIFMPPAPVALWPILIPIEIVGIFTKPFALMIRLFANMTAGHIIVISLVGLIFFFESLAVSPVSVAFALFIDVLECLVALLQAYIFTMLTALFIGSASASHDHDEAHAEGH